MDCHLDFVCQVIASENIVRMLKNVSFRTGTLFIDPEFFPSEIFS